MEDRWKGCTAGLLLAAVLAGLPAWGEEGWSLTTVLQRSYDVRTMLHMASVELGWRLADHWVMRTGLGGVFTVVSNTRVDPEFEPALPAVTNLFTRLAEDYLDDTYTSYVHLPVVSFSVGYRF